MSSTRVAACVVLAALPLTSAAHQKPLANADLTTATLVTAKGASPVERQAARMLVEEAARRGGRWRIAPKAPATGPAIYLGSVPRKPTGLPSQATSRRPYAEGYRLIAGATGGRTVVSAIGNDERGCMFASGALLRLLEWGDGRVRVLCRDIETAPAKPMRGHQIGWRPTANSYDRWGLKEFEQYIREMVVWGANAIELIPFDSTYDREKNTRFTCALADLIASYGLHVWLWYPIGDDVPPGMTGPGLVPGELPCPSQSAGRKYILDRRNALFARMKHLDGVLIPGGDPGGCKCEKCSPWVDTLLPLAQDIAKALHRYHPKAGLWLSNQGFLEEHNTRFYKYLSARQPTWLAGVVHAPWVEETVASMRARTPKRYPIRQYPDICHTVRCQYPVRDWDQAFAATLGREPAIYRPTEHAHIARLYQPQTCGAITYSDGVTDDLNKVIWAAVLWDPKVSDGAVLTDYARFFFGSRAAPDVVRGIRGLEANWRGPVISHAGISKAFDLWRRLERNHPDHTKRNWRFQMALLRAYYDRYVQIKLQSETKAETDVLRSLAQPGDPIERARRAISDLDAAQRATCAPELRARLLQLGQDLFESIGLQLSVPRWGASGSERGAVLDFLDTPLCNHEWIRSQLDSAVQSRDPESVAAAIQRIVKWEDPGPGGFYDDLGNPARQPHLVRNRTWEADPGYVEGTRCDFAKAQPGYRQSWANYAETLYGAPIIMRYTGLDRTASYVIRATYSGRYRPTMTLVADERYEVHGPVPTTDPPTIGEWPIPKAATADGTLTLRWNRVTGRGAQVSEVWLIRKNPD